MERRSDLGMSLRLFIGKYFTCYRQFYGNDSRWFCLEWLNELASEYNSNIVFIRITGCGKLYRQYNGNYSNVIGNDGVFL